MSVWSAKDVYLTLMILTCANYLLAERQIVFEDYCLDETSPPEVSSGGGTSTGILTLKDVNKKGLAYLPGLNCSVRLSATKEHQLLLTFSLISLRNSSLDTLTVMYDNHINNGSSTFTTLTLSGQQICSSENCTGLIFESGKGFANLTLSFVSANSTVPKNATGFLGIFTVFDYANSQGQCTGENQFVCSNKHCIWNGLVCDGHNNCGDRSDELLCGVSMKDTIWGIVVITLGVVSLVILVPVFCYLASYGTRSSVRSLTMPVEPTPMYPTINDGETANLLTSSEIPPVMDSGEFSRNTSMNYGTETLPSTSHATRTLGSLLSEALSNEKLT